VKEEKMSLLKIDVWKKGNSGLGHPDYHIVIEEGTSYKLMELIDAVKTIGSAMEERNHDLIRKSSNWDV